MLPPALAGFLLINPRSGKGRPTVDELAAAARERGIDGHGLRKGDDPAALMRTRPGAGALGIAGGDGSLAPAAQVAIERELPFVSVPFGTRNHFARDVGLDRADPLAALAAFSAEERRIDVGRVGERLFLNNVSLGAYASLVHRREGHRRRRDALAGIRALLRTPAHPHPLKLRVDGKPVSARVVLIANNAYELRLFDLGARPNLTEGRLHLYSAGGLLPTDWDERVGQVFELEPRLLPQLPAEPVERVLAFVEEAARDAPEALERGVRPAREQDTSVVDAERAGRRLRARVDDEAAGIAGEARRIATKLRAAARAESPAVELAHSCRCTPTG